MTIDDLWIAIEPGCKLPELDTSVFLWTEHGGLVSDGSYQSWGDGPHWTHSYLVPIAGMPRPKGPKRVWKSAFDHLPEGSH